MMEFIESMTLIAMFVSFWIIDWFFEQEKLRTRGEASALYMKIYRKIHFKKTRKSKQEELEETLAFNHIEYRLQKDYNLSVVCELCERSKGGERYDIYCIMLVDHDTGDIRWNTFEESECIITRLKEVLDRLDDGVSLAWC